MVTSSGVISFFILCNNFSYILILYLKYVEIIK